MTIGIIVLFAFVAVTAAVVGVFMLLSGRTQVRREKAIHDRLQEVGGAAVPTDEAGASSGTLLLKEIVGPMPNVEQFATAALKGSSVERWLQQTGTAMTISVVILITLLFGAFAAIATFMFTHLWWAAIVAFMLGLGIQPMILKHKRAGASTSSRNTFPKRSISCHARSARAMHSAPA